MRKRRMEVSCGLWYLALRVLCPVASGLYAGYCWARRMLRQWEIAQACRAGAKKGDG